LFIDDLEFKKSKRKEINVSELKSGQTYREVVLELTSEVEHIPKNINFRDSIIIGTLSNISLNSIYFTNCIISIVFYNSKLINFGVFGCTDSNNSITFRGDCNVDEYFNIEGNSFRMLHFENTTFNCMNSLNIRDNKIKHFTICECFSRSKSNLFVFFSNEILSCTFYKFNNCEICILRCTIILFHVSKIDSLKLKESSFSDLVLNEITNRLKITYSNIEKVVRYSKKVDSQLNELVIFNSYFKSNLEIDQFDGELIEIVDSTFNKSLIISYSTLTKLIIQYTTITEKLFVNLEKIENLELDYTNMDELEITPKAFDYLKTRLSKKCENYYKQIHYLHKQFSKQRDFINADASYIELMKTEGKIKKNVFKRLGNTISYGLSNYGTNPYLLFLWIFLVNIIFSIIIIIFDKKEIFDAIYLSVITFLTVGYGDTVVVSSVTKVAMMIEGFLGVFFMAYFTVTVFRKSMR
jgi:hypothetical protein